MARLEAQRHVDILKRLPRFSLPTLTPERLLCGAAVFVSAFLLFLVQPLLGKALLPLFGGSAAVWSACLVFFQGMLLAGYAYAHAVAHLPSPRAQWMVHSALLLGSLLLLPLDYPVAGKETAAWGVLASLTGSIGIPYLLLAATSPLVQAWYARMERRELPYRLFAVSNLASLAALLLYPILIEPVFGLPLQMIGWTAGYTGFILLMALVAWRARSAPKLPAPEELSGMEVSFAQFLLWLLLPAAGSMLLVSATTHLTQNIAPAPFLWVVPLALYLLTYVIAFADLRWMNPPLLRVLAIVGSAVLIVFYLGQGYHWSARIGIPAVSLALFACCLFCHGELALRKPDPRHLTFFYLTIAAGGALGGLLAGLGAPAFLSGYFELPLSALLCASLAMLMWPLLAEKQAWAAVLMLFLAGSFVAELQAPKAGVLYAARNFYGAIQVREQSGEGPKDAVRKLLNGSINHGEQFLAEEKRMLPTTYFGPDSGAGLALRHCFAPGSAVGIIGLGAGTLATYAADGDHFRFFEINPQVLIAAQEHFSFLRQAHGKVDVLIGDGRMLLERQPDAVYDLLVVDAFSGDAIPVHLLTLEALQLYFAKLKPQGVLALHLSNAYLDLTRVAGAAANLLGLPGRVASTEPDALRHLNSSTWVVIGPDACTGSPEVVAATSVLEAPENFRVWTDDYSNLLAVLK